MKKSLISILAAVAALAGCQRADIDTISSEKYADSYSFSAQIVQPGDADSKLGLDATGLQMFWESGDEILVSSDEASLVSFNTNENGAAVNFYSGTVLEGKYFDAYYGLGATADNLPATFANYIPGDVKHLPLYAHSTSRQLTFNCATAVLKVCTYNVGGQNVDKVTVTSDLDIAGDVEFNNSVMSVSGTKTITLTTSNTDESKIFYVPVVPGSHQLTIKSYCGANLVGEMTTKSSVAVSAKTVYTIFLGKVFYIYKDKVECKNPDDGETSAQTAAKYVSFTTSGTTYTYTLLKDGNYNIVAGEQFDGDNDKVELKTATEAPVPSVPNIFFDGAQNTIMTLDINTPASHVEIEQGISKYVNSITSATTLVIKPTYKILEDAVLKAGAIIIEGNPAATVKSQDSHVNTVVLDPESAQTPVSVSIVNDANVKIIKNQSQYDVAADINVTDVAYVGQIINSSTTNTSSVEIEVKKEGQIGKVKNEDTTNTLNVDTDGQKDIQTEGDVNIASNVAKIGETKYTTIAAALAAAEEGQTIVLLTDITLEDRINIGKSVDFDLGGYTVTGPAESEKSYVFSYDGYEASPDHSKRISGKVYNGTINCNKIGVYAADHADVVIENLTVNQKKTTDGKANFNHCAIAASYGSTLTVNGGTYNGDIAAGIFSTGGHIIINEGTFKGETYALDVYPASSSESESDSEISVIGGVIYGALKLEDGVGIKGFEKKITVAGGTFDNDPSAYIIPGYHAVPSGHFYNVEAIDPVAKIGTFTFASLEDAIAAVPTDGSKTVITLLADITTTEANGFAIAKGKSAVIDLNARTITANLENTGACAVFNIANGASLVMKDSQNGGQVILTPAVPGDPASSKNFGTSVFQNNGSLTIESGYYENKGDGGSSYVVDNNSNSVEATAIINDGYFKAVKTPVRMCCNSTQYSNNLTINGGEIESGRYGVILASQNKDANKANLIVNGGRITTTDSYKLDIYIQANSGANTSAIFATINDVDCPQNIGISGSITAANINILGGKIGEVEPWGNQKVVSGGIYTVSPSDYLKEGFEVVANTDEETKTAYPYAIAKLEPVAKIGNTYYLTLQEAVAAVEASQTIELLADINYGEFSSEAALSIPSGKSFVLNLGGHTIQGIATKSGASELIMIDETASVELQNGTITYKSNQPDPSWGYGTSTIVNHGTLTLTSGKVINTTVLGASYAIDNSCNVWGVRPDVRNAVLNVNGGEITCEQGDQAVRLFANAGDTQHKTILNMTAGTITAGGIWCNIITNTQVSYIDEAYECNISGGTVNGNLDFISNGSNASVNISGGIFNTTKLRLRNPNSCGSVPSTPYINITGGKWTISSWDDKQATNKSLAISGGIFAAEPAAKYIKNGYVVVANTDAETKDAYPLKVVEKQPIEVTSESALKTAINNASAGDIIKFTNNITLTSGIKITKDITIDLNGKTLSTGSMNGVAAEGIRAIDANGGNVTIKNGTVTGPSINYGYGLMMAYENSSLLLENITATTTGNCVISRASTGPVTIKSGTFTSTGTGDNHSSGAAVGVQGMGKMTIEGGTYNGSYYSALIMSSGGTINITGGTFNEGSEGFSLLNDGYASATSGSEGHINISGSPVVHGDIRGRSNGNSGQLCYISISGGTYDNDCRLYNFDEDKITLTNGYSKGTSTDVPNPGAPKFPGKIWPLIQPAK